ncbi:reverse transcriptase-like protein [Halorussus salilacus]|uniref:reverse transcriptase-like protein n=1 Tax=Halorussus salilacus TaxID=2953750 RepID=UPI00209DF567|nr:reverse transcriptase-like protein [Halorussus salilacus]USZ67686.1 reverse transcriptase-like protein [Halorussus salilacus]
MAVHGRPSQLRALFDESPTPHIAHPPRTHHRDFYVATDGSYSLDSDDGGLGAIIETRDGERVARIAVPDSTVADNNAAEYRALHLGLDVLAARAPRDARVGVVVDHDDLAANVNSASLATRRSDHVPPRKLRVPDANANHWRGIRARICGFDEVRAAVVESDSNPAHALANAPGEYAHVNAETDRCLLPDSPASSEAQIPPPSRADRRASD